MKSKSSLLILTVLVLLTSVTVKAQLSAEELLEGGIKLFEKKDYLGAKEQFEKALELNPKLAEAYYFRGRVQLEDDKADADFTKAIELKPNYPEAYFQRGLKNDLKDNRPAAMNDYNKAIELNPSFIDAYRTRAFLFLLDKKGQLAIADYTKIVELKPDGESYYMRGNSYLEIGEYLKAVGDLTKSIQLDPTYYWSYKQRAKAYRKLKRFRLAQADEHKATEIGPPRIT